MEKEELYHISVIVLCVIILLFVILLYTTSKSGMLVDKEGRLMSDLGGGVVSSGSALRSMATRTDAGGVVKSGFIGYPEPPVFWVEGDMRKINESQASAIKSGFSGNKITEERLKQAMNYVK